MNQAVAKQKHLIQTKTSNSNLGVILLDLETMQEIKTNSGELAKANEYQTHFWALVVRATGTDKSIIDICRFS